MRDFSNGGRSAVFASNGMCATSHPLAAKVAVQILEAGGNAVDAAIAGAVLLGICEPQMTGIGGDCFVLMTPAGSDEVIALNGSGRAPSGLDAAALRAKGTTVPVHDAAAVTLPGAVDAFCTLAKDHGRLGLKAALAPAIFYAETGVPVAPRVAFDWAQMTGDLTGAARAFYLLDGQAPRTGQLVRAPQQAEVLRRIAMEGRAGFYEGEVAEDMVASLNALGGVHTVDDFAGVACDYTQPVSGAYGGLELFEHPPNGQGATAILLLNILKHFDFAGMDLTGAARAFYLLDGKAPRTGQLFRAPQQAEVLRRIAMEGRAGFYEGEIAEDMVASLNALGGVHTVDDFAGVACDYTQPVSGGYGGLELFEHPPNGQGATAILLLNILKHFDFAGMDPMGAARAHIEAEATKLAYDTRNRMIADPDHTARLAHMLAPETAEKLAGLIDPKRVLDAGLPGAEAVHKDTVYITVVDNDRMCVSLIYSIFHGFGSGLASDKFGILFQNRGAGFTLEEGHPNEAGPGKRPMHTIIPGLLKQDGRPYMPFGVMGGQYQSTGHARFISNMRDFGMDAQAAISAPRCFAEGSELRVETGYSDTVRQALVDLGHNVVTPEGPIGGAQAIAVHESGVLEGASDPRKDGCAVGF